MKKAGIEYKSIRKNRKNFLVPVICLIFMWLSAAVVYGAANESPEDAAAKKSQKNETPDFNRLVGSWVRPDGGYVIEISKIHPDGTADAAYLNPRPINVAKAKVSEIDGMLGLFIKLEDQGYPGSTYALKYNPEYDAMVGVYFQAAIKQSYDVIFQRK